MQHVQTQARTMEPAVEVETYALADESPPPVVHVPPAMPALAHESEELDGLVSRAARVLGAVSRTQVSDALSAHGRIKVEMAIRKIEEPGSKARGWGYVLGILADWHRRKTVVAIPESKPMAASAAAPKLFKPSDYMLNYNPGLGRRDVEPTAPEAAAALRSMIGRIGPVPAPDFARASPPIPSPRRPPRRASRARADPQFTAFEDQVEAAERDRRRVAPAVPVASPEVNAVDALEWL